MKVHWGLQKWKPLGR